ncbi:MAG: hypothetical protein LBH06_06650 [Rikenellaceae bacterium]|jgi:hypothetical protein|nr:hypothetical protein [Rikenellaceae bacterium]
MKKTFSFSALAAVALAAGLASCEGGDKNKGGENNNSSPSNRIEAPVTVTDSEAASIVMVKAIAYIPSQDGSATLATGSYTNGKLTIELPATPEAEFLQSFTEEEMEGFITISDNAAKKTSHVILIAYDANGYTIGEFKLIGSNTTTDVEGGYTYADRAFTISGSEGNHTVSLSFKKGWNITYIVETETSELYTTTKPGGINVQWVYNSLTGN